MACLLVLVVAAAVLTAPPGKLAQAARTTSPEAFWRAALPNAPMPESVRELLRPGAGMHAEVKPPSADDLKPRDDDPPPMNFNYDDYRASSSISPQDQAAPAAKAVEHAASTAKTAEHAAGARNGVTDDDAGASPATVFFLEDAVRVGGSLPFPRRLPRAAPHGEAAADQQPPLELRTVRAVRAVQRSSFVVCRGEAPGSAGGGHAVYGCRGVAGPARAYVVDVAGERGDAVIAAVVCRADGKSSPKLGHAALRLLDAKPGGVAACYAVPDAQILLVKSNKVPSSA
ncbi:BURP domain-containing protein 15-like [Panicum miliaceum]|uniref:BURP domain-containing protein 15-like n=1 Tax=Panicum miliaceum TaxID=4540 RepID=A0A3L6TED1_PANMI|nr:BURP domain-containing protein 15-like [Panicum miliaceum]